MSTTTREAENLVQQDSFDIIIPASFLTESTTGECSVLIEIDHNDATLLDFEGASGAIGRFEANENGRELYHNIAINQRTCCSGTDQYFTQQFMLGSHKS